MSSFDWKKDIEDSIRDALIMTITTTGIFYALKAANVKPPKASLNVMDIMKLAGRIAGCVLVKDLQKIDQRVIQQQNFVALSRAIKLHDVKCRSILRGVRPRRVLLTHVYTALLFNR